jgi:hypothetical protein
MTRALQACPRHFLDSIYTHGACDMTGALRACPVRAMLQIRLGLTELAT